MQENMVMCIRGKILGLSAVAVAAALCVAGPARAATSKKDPVVAIVNGSKITKAEVMKTLQGAPGKKLNDEQMKFLFPQAVEMLVSEKLIDQAIAKSKVRDSAAYKKQVEFIKAQVAKQMFFRTYLKGKVTEKEVKAEYGKFKKANAGKQEVHAFQIVVPTKVEAEQVVKDLKAGKKFEDLARERSSDAQSAKHGGEIGWFSKDELPTPFEPIAQAAFKLKPGQYTQKPVKTDFGWHVIKVTEKRARKVPALAMVEGKIREKLSNEAVSKMIAGLRKKASIKFFDLKGKPESAAKAAAAAKKK